MRKHASEQDYDSSIEEDSKKMEAELAQGADAAEMALLRTLLKQVLASFPYVYMDRNHPIVHKFYSMLDVESLLPDSQHLAGCDVHQEGKV